MNNISTQNISTKYATDTIEIYDFFVDHTSLQKMLKTIFTSAFHGFFSTIRRYSDV